MQKFEWKTTRLYNPTHRSHAISCVTTYSSCVCVCVCIFMKRWMQQETITKRKRNAERKQIQKPVHTHRRRKVSFCLAKTRSCVCERDYILFKYWIPFDAETSELDWTPAGLSTCNSKTVFYIFYIFRESLRYFLCTGSRTFIRQHIRLGSPVNRAKSPLGGCLNGKRRKRNERKKENGERKEPK